MDKFGIKNIKDENLIFNYDAHYRKLGLDLKKSKTEEESTIIKINSADTLNKVLKNIDVNEQELKRNFINLLLDEEGPQYLWILYSKTENSKNYIDRISNILKLENKVIRSGTNTYKVNRLDGTYFICLSNNKL